MRGLFRREAIWMLILPLVLVIVALLAALLMPKLANGQVQEMDQRDTAQRLFPN